MINLILRQLFYYRIKHNKIPEDVDNHLHYSRTTFNSFNNPEYIKESFPWGPGFDPPKNIKTTYEFIKQRFGIFHCKAKLDPKKGCFWLLWIGDRYNEIDHFEFFNDCMKLTTWYGKDGGQLFFEPIERIYPLFEMRKKYCCKLKSFKFKSPEARKWVLDKAHIYTIIWKRGYILWKIDGIPLAITFKWNAIPKQHMSMILTNYLNFYSFRSGI